MKIERSVIKYYIRIKSLHPTKEKICRRNFRAVFPSKCFRKFSVDIFQIFAFRGAWNRSDGLEGANIQSKNAISHSIMKKKSPWFNQNE